MSQMSQAAKGMLRNIAAIATLPECPGLGSVGYPVRGRAQNTAEELKSAGLGRLVAPKASGRGELGAPRHYLYLTPAGRKELERMIKDKEIRLSGY